MGKKESTGNWINNFARVWQKKGEKKFFMSMPLAEPVTLKLQRKTKDGFAIQEVTLVPEENEKGYSSIMFTMKKPEAYEYNGETITPPENLKYEISVPPGGQGDGESDF